MKRFRVACSRPKAVTQQVKRRGQWLLCVAHGQPRLTLCLVALLGFLAAGALQAHAAQNGYAYRLILTPTLGGSSSAALGLNDRGEVVGGAARKGDLTVDAFSWRAGRMRDLGSVGMQPESYATSVNDSGVVTGIGQDSGGNSSIGGVWRRGHGWKLLSRRTCNSVANFINAYGSVGGSICHHDKTWSDQTRAAVWKWSAVLTGQRPALLDARDWYSVVNQISGAGDAVGLQIDGRSVAHALYWMPDGRSLALGRLVGPNSVAWGLTDTPSRAGRSILAVGGADTIDGNENACYWRFEMSSDLRRAIQAPGRCEGIGSLPGFPTSELLAVSCYAAVGDVSAGNDARAVIWTAGAGLQDLNGLVAPTPVVLAQADAINAAGEIVGLAVLPNGDTRAFVLEPIRFEAPTAGS